MLMMGNVWLISDEDELKKKNEARNVLLISETPFEAIPNTSMCWTVVHSESSVYTGDKKTP